MNTIPAVVAGVNEIIMVVPSPNGTVNHLVLAAAHLAGQGNVKKFFRSGNEFKDGYGTRLTSYMTKFSGYHLDL